MASDSFCSFFLFIFFLSSLHRYLSADTLLHELTHLLWGVVFALQIHEFGDSCLYGAVVAADNACLLKLVACVVASHLHTALQTLADIDDDLASASAFAQGAEQPGTLGRIA